MTVLEFWSAEGNPKLGDEAIQMFAAQVDRDLCKSSACTCSGTLLP